VIANTMRLPTETIDAVRSAVRAEDVIAERIPLRRSGKVLVGSCPWHKSRSGRSFIVYPDRQSWRCWGCAVGGDVFDFLGRYAGASFPATVKLLAAQAGIELDGEVPHEVAEALSARTELAQVDPRPLQPRRGGNRKWTLGRLSSLLSSPLF
jgi:DNA primase